MLVIKRPLDCPSSRPAVHPSIYIHPALHLLCARVSVFSVILGIAMATKRDWLTGVENSSTRRIRRLARGSVDSKRCTAQKPEQSKEVGEGPKRTRVEEARH